VVVAQPVADVQHSQRTLALTLLLTFPLLLLVLGLIAWRVTSAALRPVDSLRRSADRISGTGGDDQLPLPVAHDEIRALAETLNAMLERLADVRLRQRAFVADAAHELRSPLASMKTQLEVAQRVDGHTALTDDLHLDVVRMSALVDDLLTLARLDGAHPDEPRAEPVSLAPVLTDLVAACAGARVDVQLGEIEPCAVLVRHDDLRRVVRNLLDNAVRHAATSVRVTARGLDEGAVVSVTDDGPGIAPADRDRVFERFTRLDASRDRDTGGSGLGLAIVQGLVTRAGGSVQLTDAPDGGLLVEVTLPAIPVSTVETESFPVSSR
jgi:signal transduction histidine kinase